VKVPFFVFVILGIILGGNVYVFYRLWQLMPPIGGRILFIVVVIVLLSAPVIGMAPTSPLPVSWCSWLSKLGTSWLIILLYLVLTFAFFDILRATGLFPSLPAFLNASWAGFSVLTVAMAALLVTGYCRYRDKVRVELTVPLDKPLPGGPLKIVAVSDLHLGYTIGKDELEEWIDLINKETPDLILIAGDVTDNNVRPLFTNGMAASFHRLRSRYGVYAIPGNHEYIAGITKAAAFLHAAGITLLQDSAVLIDECFYLVGRDDRSNPHRKILTDLTVPLDKSKPILLLDHQPLHLEETAAAGIDFQFSGHTHDGQVWPLNHITDHLFECSHGYIRKGGSHIYVSSGLGIWGGKFRIGTCSEYLVLTLETSREVI
jgi:predicted MPP superfamily phosphohydrolase